MYKESKGILMREGKKKRKRTRAEKSSYIVSGVLLQKLLEGGFHRDP